MPSAAAPPTLHITQLALPDAVIPDVARLKSVNALIASPCCNSGSISVPARAVAHLSQFGIHKFNARAPQQTAINPRFFTKNATQPRRQLNQPHEAPLAEELVGQGVKSLDLGAPGANDDAAGGEVVRALEGLRNDDERAQASKSRMMNEAKKRQGLKVVKQDENESTADLVRFDTCRTSHFLGSFFTS